jgi:hypothetical protein
MQIILDIYSKIILIVYKTNVYEYTFTRKITKNYELL